MQGRASKNKGKGYEREVVNQARALGLTAERAWGSNGEAMGEVSEVDVKIEGITFQCKRRKKLPTVYTPPEGVAGQLVREDNGRSYAILPLEALLAMLLAVKAIKEVT